VWLGVLGVLGVLGCAKIGPGLDTGAPLAAIVEDGPPPPAWDWWTAGTCPGGATFTPEIFPDGGTVIRCIPGRPGTPARGPGAAMRDGHTSVGNYDDDAQVGPWPEYDAGGHQTAIRVFVRDVEVFGALYQDGAPLVMHRASACELDREIARRGHPDLARPDPQCVERMPFFPGVAITGVYANDAGCLDRVWVIDCVPQREPPSPRSILARGGWASARGDTRGTLALRYLGEALDRTRLEPGATVTVGADGTVVIEGWQTTSSGGGWNVPTETRAHRRWRFTPDGDVTSEPLGGS
jgi:hypothetical protein